MAKAAPRTIMIQLKMRPMDSTCQPMSVPAATMRSVAT